MIFFIWPDLPQWIPYFFPTYYFMKPLFEVAIQGAELVSVLPLMGIGLVICAGLFPIVFRSGGRLQARLAAS